MRAIVLFVIRSFADATTKDIWNGRNTRAARLIPHTVWPAARRKMDMLHQVERVQELRVPPGNRLEALRGSRAGQDSVRVNDQYRLTFTFTDGHAFDVCCEDYH